MTANTGTEAAPSPESSTPADKAADAVDVEALKAAAARLADLEAKIASEKKADRDARKRAQEEAEKAGELAKALEAAKARLAELEGLEPLAQRWRAFEADEIKRLDGEAASLPDAARDLYVAASDVDGKRKVLAAFKAVAPAADGKTKAPGTPMGAPPPSHEIDFAAAFRAGGEQWADARRRDPKGADAFVSGQGRVVPTSTLFGGLFRRPAS